MAELTLRLLGLWLIGIGLLCIGPVLVVGESFQKRLGIVCLVFASAAISNAWRLSFEVFEEKPRKTNHK